MIARIVIIIFLIFTYNEVKDIKNFLSQQEKVCPLKNQEVKKP